MHDFTYNNISLSSFGGRLLQPPTHTIAERNKSFAKIYGQSGDEVIDNESYDNVKFKLKICFMPYIAQQSAQSLAYAVINWLAPLQDKYYVYRDTVNPDYFTYAVLTNFDQIVRELPTLLTTTLEFNRVPFWYSDVGAQPVSQSAAGYVNLRNPEQYASEPIVQLEYTGTAGNNYYCTLYMRENIQLLSGGINKLQVLDGVAKQHYKIDNGVKTYLSDLLPPMIEPNVYYSCYAKLGIYSEKGRDLNLTITPNWRRL